MANTAQNPTRRSVRRAQLLESLESRQMMAVFSASVNFQPSSSTSPAGYVADTGKAYSWQGAYQFGWNANNTANTVDRYTSANDRYDTFAYLDRGASKWEIEVPNGQYRVNVTSGDPTSLTSNYVINVEGSTLINETPHAGNRWSEGSGTVTVSDGRLTISSGSGAYNNKINSVSLTQLTDSSGGTSGAAFVLPKGPAWAGTWGATANSVWLNWGDNSTNETGFIIEQSTNGTSFSEAARVAANVDRAQLTSLTASTDYYFRVKAYNNAGVTSSANASARTLGAPTTPTAQVPANPSWIAASTSSSSSVSLQWGDTSWNETGYIIQRGLSSSTLVQITQVGANSTTFTDTGLAADTTYYYKVLPFNSAGTGSSTVTSARTNPGVVAVKPAAPSWASSYSVSSSSGGLNWGDASNNETGFIVERSTDGWNFAEVARVGANVTSFNPSGLNASTTYYFRVMAYNGAGNSNASQTTSFATSAGTPTVYVPAAPSWVSSSASGSNAGVVTWGDASNNETGFIVQRATDGWNFVEAGRVGANVTTFNASGLNASTTYQFRVLAYNTAGNSAVSAATSFSTSATQNNGNNGNNGSNGILNKYALSGISANTNGDPVSSYSGALNDVGIQNVRVWYSFTNWDAQPDSWYINRAMAYKNAGYKVMLAVLNPNPASSEAQAKAFFQRLAAYPGLNAAVDYWQINNEPNMGSFWRGSLQQYVQTNLKPAYEVLKGYGETVVGAGPSWDVNAARQLTSYGYLNYCDYAAFHPYGESAAIVIERAAGARAAYNNKPMMVTEWNIQSVSDQNLWVSELNKAAIGLSNIAAMNYYFALKQSATHVGTGGLLKYDGSRNTLFYDAVKGWLR